MALSLLLDENMSPEVARKISKRRPEIPVLSIHTWRDGDLVGSPDEAVITGAYEDGLILVTFDTQILSDMSYWFDQELPFSGLIFIDDRTIGGNNFGTLAKAIIHLWDNQQELDWTNRLVFLASPLST